MGDPGEPSSWSGAAVGPTSSEGTETEIPSDFLREVARAPASAPLSESDLSGRTLGRYRVVSRLGRGAMGVVYAAEDQVLRRPVALKVLPPHLLGDAERRRRFLREARAAAAAAHPNIAAVYDVDESGEQVFIAMERAPGRTLREALGTHGRGLPMAEVARIGQEIASGLARAHEAHVVHRDLKPDNVMIGPAGEVKILDFGVAKLREDRARSPVESQSVSITEEGQLLGTPAYMAPEQAKGLAAVDERADIFSLGVMLYEMATGARPFTGKTSAEVIIAVDRDEPAPPSRRNPAVPAELSRIIARCLQKRAEDRYPRAADLAEDLRRLGASIDLAAPSSSRRRWRAIAIAALAAIPIAAVALVRTARHAGAQHGSPDSSAAATSPLARPDAALACPMLDVTGIDEPSGWFGAAAATVACRRARAVLGGAAARVITPAALLDLPAMPRDDAPSDPFGEPDAQAKTLAAARARGAAYLTGSVERRPEEIRVRLVLKDAADREIGVGEGRSLAIHQAVQAALDQLVRPDAIPHAAAVDPEVARWSTIHDPALFVAVNGLEFAALSRVELREQTARLLPRRAEIGPLWERVLADAASVSGEGWDQIAAPPIDRSSPAAFAASAPVHALLDPHADAAALADEANKLAAAEPSAMGRRALAYAEAQLRNRAGDDDRAHALLMRVVESDPSSDAWDTLANTVHERSSRDAVARGYVTWRPDVAEAWNLLTLSDDSKSPRTRAPIFGMRRARILSPAVPLYAVHASMNTLAAGKREEARAIAADLLSAGAGRDPSGGSDPRIVAGEYVLASVEASEGRFGAALARARRVLAQRPSFGSLLASDMYLATLAVDLGMLLGRAREVADEIARLFVDPDPPRLSPGRYVPSRIASVCALASPDVAKRCFDRLRGLVAAGYFREDPLQTDAQFIPGAEAYARGDFVAAAAAWRPLGKMPSTNMRNLLPDAFDRVGEPEIAERCDEWMLGVKGPFNGVGLAHFRQAKRLAARKDRKEALYLARLIVDAWSMADAPVPEVAEMRALIAKLGGQR